MPVQYTVQEVTGIFNLDNKVRAVDHTLDCCVFITMLIMQSACCSPSPVLLLHNVCISMSSTVIACARLFCKSLAK